MLLWDQLTRLKSQRGEKHIFLKVSEKPWKNYGLEFEKKKKTHFGGYLFERNTNIGHTCKIVQYKTLEYFPQAAIVECVEYVWVLFWPYIERVCLVPKISRFGFYHALWNAVRWFWHNSSCGLLGFKFNKSVLEIPFGEQSDAFHLAEPFEIAFDLVCYLQNRK